LTVTGGVAWRRAEDPFDRERRHDRLGSHPRARHEEANEEGCLSRGLLATTLAEQILEMTRDDCGRFLDMGLQHAKARQVGAAQQKIREPRRNILRVERS